MKKLTFIFLTVAPFLANAQGLGNLDESLDAVSVTVKRAFPVILLIIFIVGFLFNASHFFGENQDIKKGISRILVFVGIGGLVSGICTWILAISL